MATIGFASNTDQTFDQKVNQIKADAGLSTIGVVVEHGASLRVNYQLVKAGYWKLTQRRALAYFHGRVEEACLSGVSRVAMIYDGTVMAIWHAQPTPPADPVRSETLSAALAQVDEIHAQLKQEIDDGLQAEADYVKFYASADDDLSDPDVYIDEPVNSKPLATYTPNHDDTLSSEKPADPKTIDNRYDPDDEPPRPNDLDEYERLRHEEGFDPEGLYRGYWRDDDDTEDELKQQLAERDAQIAALQAELESRRRIMDEINDLLYDAQGKPGTRVFNQTSMVDDVKRLIAERDALNTNDAQAGE